MKWLMNMYKFAFRILIYMPMFKARPFLSQKLIKMAATKWVHVQKLYEFIIIRIRQKKKFCLFPVTRPTLFESPLPKTFYWLKERRKEEWFMWINFKSNWQLQNMSKLILQGKYIKI